VYLVRAPPSQGSALVFAGLVVAAALASPGISPTMRRVGAWSFLATVYNIICVAAAYAWLVGSPWLIGVVWSLGDS